MADANADPGSPEPEPATAAIALDLDVSDALPALPGADLPDAAACARAATEALREADAELLARGPELSLRLVGDEESAELNQYYRGKVGPTNVLSFPAELPEGVPLAVLGDLIICVPVVLREAAEQGKTPADHFRHMVVHGTLHLAGLDHIEPAEAEHMEGLEIRVMARLGCPNPYI